LLLRILGANQGANLLMSDPKKAPDWAAIEKDYRAGTRKIREIARWFSISDTAIRKRAKAEGWTQEKKAKGSQQTASANLPVADAPKSDVSRVEDVIGRGRNVADRLLDELAAETLHKGEMEVIIQMNETNPDRVQALKQALSLPTRAKTLQTITLALKTMGETVTEGGSGKKAQRKNAAEAATAPGGKFAPRPGPPQLSVVGGNK
jgi:hypothetical protein